MFAPKCGGCARAILENYISALNTLWHPECFVCRVRRFYCSQWVWEQAAGEGGLSESELGCVCVCMHFTTRSELEILLGLSWSS